MLPQPNQPIAQPKTLVVPVVYLKNTYIAHQAVLEVPANNTEEVQQEEKLSDEDMAFLRDQCHMKTVQLPVEEQVEAELPIYITPEMVAETDRIINQVPEYLATDTPDQKTKKYHEFMTERRMRLYALYQTQPWAFRAINQELPDSYKLSECPNFVSPRPVELNTFDVTGKQLTSEQKYIQLSPAYYGEHPPEIKQDAFSCLSVENLFGPPEEAQEIFDYLGFKPGPCIATSLVATRKLKRCTAMLASRGNTPVSFSFIRDEDKAELQQNQKRSSFVEKYKDKVKAQFLTLINVQHKQLHAQELVDVLQSLDQHKPQDSLEIAVSMLYFDKLDIIYTFQLMQQVTQLNLRNLHFGWPTTYPVKSTEQTITQIAHQTEKRYMEVRQKTQNLSDIYLKIFIQNKKSFEQSLPKNMMLPKQMEKQRVFIENGVQMYELKVNDGTITGIINIPKQLYEDGIHDRSHLHKQLIETIHQAMQNLKQSRTQIQKRKKDEGKPIEIEVAESEPEQKQAPLRKWRKTIQKRFQIKQKLSERELNQRLIFAGKMNTITLFDLDIFFEMCVGLCGIDLDYPPFYYEDFQSKCAFGSQISLIKAPRQIYSVLLRFLFGPFGYIEKNVALQQYLQFYRCPATVSTEMLDDNVYAQSIVEENFQIKKVQETKKTEYLLPTLEMTQEMFEQIKDGTAIFTKVVKECIDNSNYAQINKKDIKMLECGPSCNHCACDYKNLLCNGKCQKDFERPHIKGLKLCPCIFDFVKKQLKPGFPLLSRNDVFLDDEDDPQLFTYVTEKDDMKFKDYEEANECFLQFENYSTPNSFKRINYAVMVVQLVELFSNSVPVGSNTALQIQLDELFSDYFSCRTDALVTQNPVENYWQRFESLKRQLSRVNGTAKSIAMQHFDRLSKPYDRITPSADLFKNSIHFFDFKVLPSNFFTVKAISSFYNARAHSDTELVVLNHNLRSPDVILEMLNENVIEKDGFSYPITDSNADVDMSVLKKDSVLQKLRQFQQSYKVMPDDMQKLIRQHNDELFELGIYEKEPYHTPISFNETRLLANSVINRGKYFTIPFGSEQHRQVENVDGDECEQSDAASVWQRSNLMSIKSQYIKWSGPTGAEAQVCHIEEEQLCYGLFRLRANCLMKILITWIAVYMPGMLKFFECALSTTVMEAPPDLSQHYTYRTKIELELAEKQIRKVETYFTSNAYQHQLEHQEQEKSPDETKSDEDIQFFVPFSLEFDTALSDIMSIYQNFSKVTEGDDMLNKAKAQNIQDAWQRQCYAPIQQWPFGQHSFSLPPPPYIPAILQYFLTQFYTTGDILEEMFKNPIITVPIIARTIQHQIGLLRHAEQRSAAVWRILYPDAYYRSQDHANVFLQAVDKKLMQPKNLLQDLQRRVSDYESGNNPNLSVDSQIDYCAPKVFQAVCFSKYFNQQRAANIELNAKMMTNYFDRLSLTQQFFPKSRVQMQFKFTATASQQELFRISNVDMMSPEMKDLSCLIFKRLMNNVFTADDENYTSDKAQLADERIQKILTLYPNANGSLLLNNQQIRKQMMDVNQFFISGIKTKPDESTDNESDDILYMEDLIFDLCNSDKMEPDYSKSMYEDETLSKLADQLKLLKFDNQDSARYLRQKLEQAIQQNRLLPSLFNDENQKVISNVFTRYRSLSMPTVTPRSLYLFRACLFAEPLTTDLVIKIVTNELTTEQLRVEFQRLTDGQRETHIKQIAKENQTSAARAAAQSQMPGAQTELCKRQIFDEFIVPALIELPDEQCKLRYIDNEMYLLLRQIAIICYRLEYTIRVLELPTVLNPTAAVGTRFQHPVPLSVQNQSNIGCSLFGHNILARFDEQQQRSTQKSVADSIPLYVSQRVLGGHQPYGNMLNTLDQSINGCICGCITCPFCGGVGAGLNGTLGGSPSFKVMQIMSELEPSMANGLYVEDSRLTWEQICFCDIHVPKARLHQIDAFLQQNVTVSLLYKLRPCVPRPDWETEEFATADDKDRFAKPQRRASTSSHADDEPEIGPIDILSKIKALQTTKLTKVYVPDAGFRLCDTTSLPPPPDCYTAAFYSKHLSNPFVRDYMARTHPLTRDATDQLPTSLGELLDIDSLVYDDPAECVISCGFDTDFAAFSKRCLILENERELLIEQKVPQFFRLLLMQAPNSQDTYQNDQIYALLGARAYPFLSLKKLITGVAKRMEGVAGRMISQHYDICQAKYYRSSKCTVANNLTTSLIMFAVWQNLQPEFDVIAPTQWGNSLQNGMKDMKEPVYLLENYCGFSSVQPIIFERK